MSKRPPHFLAATKGQDWDLIIRSPGRINIIGEHTDYNGGLVLPAAIDKAIYFAVRLRSDRQLVLHALDLNEQANYQLPQNTPTNNRWGNYLLGIVDQYKQRGHTVPGMEIIFGSDLPVGAGVSSSAALEGGMSFICNEVCAANYQRPTLAQICHASSNQFMGIPSGIMDQFASLNGAAQRAILLNCDTLEHRHIAAALPAYDFLLVNSMVTHQLGDSQYPVRVAECREGLAELQKTSPAITALGQAKPAMIEAIKDQLSAVVYRRCRYVTEEMERVHQAVAALEAGDAIALGSLLNATHVGLRDLYEVSCAEVDFLQGFATSFAGVAGSRIMGGGFGGCTINLVRQDRLADFQSAIRAAYQQAYDILPDCYAVPLSGGTELIGPE